MSFQLHLFVPKLALGTPGASVTFLAMSTLAEIEAAVDKLPAAEQKALLQFIAERVHRSEALADDPVATVIGAYSSGKLNDTGSRAEEMLHGHEDRLKALTVLQGHLALDVHKVGTWQMAVREARR